MADPLAGIKSLPKPVLFATAGGGVLIGVFMLNRRKSDTVADTTNYQDPADLSSYGDQYGSGSSGFPAGGGGSVFPGDYPGFPDYATGDDPGNPALDPRAPLPAVADLQPAPVAPIIYMVPTQQAASYDPNAYIAQWLTDHPLVQQAPAAPETAIAMPDVGGGAPSAPTGYPPTVTVKSPAVNIGTQVGDAIGNAYNAAVAAAMNNLPPNVFWNADRQRRYIVQQKRSPSTGKLTNYRLYESYPNKGDWGSAANLVIPI